MENNNLISEHNSNMHKLDKYQSINNGFISEQNNIKKHKPFTPNNNTISEHNSLKHELPKYTPNNGTISEGNEPKRNYPYKEKKEQQKPNYKNDSVKKSVSKTEIKKKNKKGRKVKISKKILIGAISIILTISTTPKLYTHYQTENIKENCIVTMYEKIEDLGYNKDNINIKEVINNSDPKFLRENIFDFYLIIENKYFWLEANEIYDLLVQKAGLSDSFDNYLIDKGYSEKQYYSSNGKDYYLVGNKIKYKNAMEAKLLAEQKEKEQKENKEKQVFEEFQNYSKGAR